jgi:hypothetical protein
VMSGLKSLFGSVVCMIVTVDGPVLLVAVAAAPVVAVPVVAGVAVPPHAASRSAALRPATAANRVGRGRFTESPPKLERGRCARCRQAHQDPIDFDYIMVFPCFFACLGR